MGPLHLFRSLAVLAGIAVVVFPLAAQSAASRAPDAILGAADLSDVSPEIGRNKLFWPAALAFDGQNLWVGEYKFSNRVVRFSKR